MSFPLIRFDRIFFIYLKFFFFSGDWATVSGFVYLIVLSIELL